MKAPIALCSTVGNVRTIRYAGAGSGSGAFAEDALGGVVRGSRRKEWRCQTVQVVFGPVLVLMASVRVPAIGVRPSVETPSADRHVRVTAGQSWLDGSAIPAGRTFVFRGSGVGALQGGSGRIIRQDRTSFVTDRDGVPVRVGPDTHSLCPSRRLVPPVPGTPSFPSRFTRPTPAGGKAMPSQQRGTTTNSHMLTPIRRLTHPCRPRA